MLAAIEVHPTSSQLGFARPRDRGVRGRPWLAWTLEAVAACPSIEHVVVVLPAEELDGHDDVKSLVASLGRPGGTRLSVRVAPGMPGYPLGELRRLRRLSPAAWRGGWAIPFALVERGDPGRLLEVCRAEKVDRLVVFPDAAPLLDAGLVEEMIAKHGETEEARVRLSTLPPGATGDIVTRGFLEDVVQNRLTLDAPFRFLPSVPERDLDTRGVYHWFAEGQVPLRHRLTADSARGQAILEHVLELSGDEPPGSLAARTRQEGWSSAISGPFPAEIRLRLTDRVARRDAFSLPRETPEAPGGLDPSVIERVLHEAARWEESRVILAGGDPMLHEDFESLLELLDRHRPGSVVLEAGGTIPGVPELEALQGRVDGIIIPLDAAESDTFERLRGRKDLEAVEEHVRELIRRSADLEGLFVGVELRLCPENQDEVEAFIDRWFEVTPWVVLSPFRNRAGQLPHDTLHPYRLPTRSGCIRIEEQAVVHPDGRVAVCDNDFELRVPAGSLESAGLGEIWTSDPLDRLRREHARGEWGGHPLCEACEDWCRRG